MRVRNYKPKVMPGPIKRRAMYIHYKSLYVHTYIDPSYDEHSKCRILGIHSHTTPFHSMFCSHPSHVVSSSQHLCLLSLVINIDSQDTAEALGLGPNSAW